MGKESRRIRRLAATPATTIDVLPDELLELVLLRVRTPVCLFRAAAACKHWRGVVSGAGFLPRFRSLHGGRPRLLLGHYRVDIGPDDEPSPGVWKTSCFVPWPRRPATDLRRRVSLDFLPHHRHTDDLVLADSRGGLLAVVCDTWNLLVCHPWSGQCRELNFPPWVLPGAGPEDRHCVVSLLGAFLLDADADAGGGGMSDFRVLWACLVNDKYHDRVTAQALVFSARDDRWLPSPSPNTEVGDAHWSGSWRSLEMVERLVGRAGGSIFWSGHRGHGHVLQLDESTREFSTFTLPEAPDERCTEYPPLYDRQTLRVVGAGAGGAIRIIRMVVDAGELKLEVFTRANGAAECVAERRASLWQLADMRVIRPLSGYFVDMAAAADHQLALVAFSSAGDTTVFSLDGETLKLECASKGTFHAQRLLPYELPWPHNISISL